MSQTTESLDVDYDALRRSALQDDMEPLTRCALFQENPVYKDLLNNFLSSDLPCAPNLPMPYINHAGICLPASDVFTEENYTWHGIFRADSTKSEWPTGLIYPPGTRIDTAVIANHDDRGRVTWGDGCDFVMISSAVLLNRGQEDSSPLPLLQIKQGWHYRFGVHAAPLSSSKKVFATPTEWFESLEHFSYGIIKITVPDKRPYKERIRARLQAALDKMEGTIFDKISYLQRELKVAYNFRFEFSIRDRYQQACVALREYKRQVYAFTHNMDLDDPEQVFAFARRGNLMKRLQEKVNVLKWILDRTPEAEKCLGKPVNILKGGRIGLWYEDPIIGVLCPMLPLPVNKKIYYKPRTFPKIAEVPSDLKQLHVTIRGGDLIPLKL